MKKLFLPLAMMCTAITAVASDYPYMVFSNKDGAVCTVKSDGVRFTVTDGQLIVSHSDGNTAFTLSALSSMMFSTAPAGAEAILN